MIKSLRIFKERLRDRLTRQTSSGRLIPEIDGLRFVAIGVVVLYHIRGYLSEKYAAFYLTDPTNSFLFGQLSLGHYGVELFFAISGFILATPFIVQHRGNGAAVSLKKYFLRRITRLEPPYIANMILLFVLFLVVKGESFTGLFSNLLASLLYQHNIVYAQPSLINSVAWSLEIEVQFYILVPLLTCVFMIKGVYLRRAILIACATTAVLANVFVLPQQGHFHVTLLQYIQYFLMGFVLADIYIVDWRQNPTQHWGWDIVGCLAWVGLTLVGWKHTLALFVFPPLTLICYMAAFRGRFFNWLFRRPILTIIGGMCYTIYLFHYQIISAVGRFTLRVLPADQFWAHFIFQSLVIIPAIVLVSALLFLILEKPFMDPRWPTKFKKKFTELMGTLTAKKLEKIERHVDGEQ
jgi:peptidoglycan/LPS O-acetylase OafA/YrhL